MWPFSLLIHLYDSSSKFISVLHKCKYVQRDEPLVAWKRWQPASKNHKMNLLMPYFFRVYSIWLMVNKFKDSECKQDWSNWKKVEMNDNMPWCNIKNGRTIRKKKTIYLNYEILLQQRSREESTEMKDKAFNLLFWFTYWSMFLTSLMIMTFVSSEKKQDPGHK